MLKRGYCELDALFVVEVRNLYYSPGNKFKLTDEPSFISSGCYMKRTSYFEGIEDFPKPRKYITCSFEKSSPRSEFNSSSLSAGVIQEPRP
jgi:hypothetical protein